MSNRLRPLLVAASLLAGFCRPVVAQEAPPPAPGDTAANPPAMAAPAAPLTLEDCVKRAIERGFALEIQRFSTANARDSVEIARSTFVPTLSVTGSQSHADTEPIAGSPGSKSDTRTARLSVNETFQTGTTVGVSTDLLRSERNPASSSSLYNPAYTSDVTISVTQPLLRGAGTAVTTATLNRAKIGLERSRHDFKASALSIVQQTEVAYYNLVYAREQLTVYKLSLELAQRLLDEAQARKYVGTATDIDVLQAQVGVANARRNVLQAEKTVKDSSDALLALIGRFELDTPVGTTKFEDFTGQIPVIESSYQLALRHQPDYTSARLALDQLKLDLAVAKNALHPTLNLDAALGFNGNRRSGWDAFSSAASRDNNNWQVDLTLNYPWGQVGDKARHRQSLATLNQQTLVVRQLEQTILVQVRSAVRAVETNSENVKIAALAAEFSTRQYDLERARFDAGLATSRDVLQTQSDLENSRVAELQARVNLQNSVAALHRLEGSSLERYQIVLPE
jgi:outer membrane protein